jgi:uncharacterized protein (DUF1778 family)
MRGGLILVARRKLLTVRASEEAMIRLTEAALLAGLTKSDFVRQAVSEKILLVEREHSTDGE